MKKTTLLLMCIFCFLSLVRAQLPSAPPPETIDNAVQGTGLFQHTYVGAGWIQGTTTNTFFNSTHSASNVAGAYFTFKFQGSLIEWYTEKKSTHGIVAISIDGGAETLIDLYSSTEQHIRVYKSPAIVEGPHTFKMRVTGTKNAAATNYYGIHDYFVVHHGMGVPNTTNTSYGNNSMDYFRSGQNNSAFGYNALNSVDESSGNTSVGSNALQFVREQSNNTAIGYNALPAGGGATGMGLNTAVGAGALANIYGPANTAVGAGAGPIDNTFFSYNSTALGYQAKTTASHQVRIGNADVTSIGGQVSWSTLSDGRFKTDLREDVSGLDFVKQLRPVSYTVDKTAVQKFLGVPDSIINSPFARKEKPIRQTGFIAQEVDALTKKSKFVFNGVDVPKNDKDPYTIRYAEFVVPLVKAVQELSDKNDEHEKQLAAQQKQIDQLIKVLGKVEAGNVDPSTEITLLQNNPNPFSSNTEIKMVLPETVVSANIIVYNLEGKELKQLQVKGRGDVSATLPGNELSAGMYIYALIVDGEVVDTKRMILTK